jgi:hypothetical protein|tara:strand:- start:270 stop:650 length:381 start_codon:yes stop_codon:yes gene_type:complete
MAKQKKDEALYVGLQGAPQIRRVVLTNLKDTLEMLKAFEEFKQIRKQKHSSFTTLKGHVEEITQLVGKLRGALPKVKQSTLKKEERPVKIAPKPKQKAAPTPIAHSELDKIENELDTIEHQLNAMG